MSKAFKWPKLPNSRPYLDKGYTSIQMREYAMKCIGEAIRNKQWVSLTEEERKSILRLTPLSSYLSPRDWTSDMLVYIESKLKGKNCGQ